MILVAIFFFLKFESCIIEKISTPSLAVCRVLCQAYLMKVESTDFSLLIFSGSSIFLL